MSSSSLLYSILGFPMRLSLLYISFKHSSAALFSCAPQHTQGCLLQNIGARARLFLLLFFRENKTTTAFRYSAKTMTKKKKSPQLESQGVQSQLLGSPSQSFYQGPSWLRSDSLIQKGISAFYKLKQQPELGVIAK